MRMTKQKMNVYLPTHNTVRKVLNRHEPKLTEDRVCLHQCRQTGWQTALNWLTDQQPTRDYAGDASVGCR